MSTTLQGLLERAEALIHDVRLDSVREWKQHTGGLAVGYMPVYVPRELLDAQGVLPVGIMGGGEDVEIIRGDAYYQSYICHIPRSTIELGLNGSLDVLDGMLFPAICDVIRNLSGMWKLQFPDKLAWYLDVPQDFSRERGGAFYRRELEALSAALHARGARAYDAEALRASIARYNAQRRAIQALLDLRVERPWCVPTSEFYLLQRAGMVLPVDTFTEWLETYRTAVEADDTRRPMDQARVLLVGSFCEQPPLGLLKTLERSGCYIVDDDLVQIHRYLKHDVPEDGDPLENLVAAFLDDAIEHPTRYAGEARKGAALVERARAGRAEGVLFCAPSFCDPALLDQPMATRALDEAGIPWTAFKYSENSGQFQVIREQAGTFADSIKLWSDAQEVEA